MHVYRYTSCIITGNKVLEILCLSPLLAVIIPRLARVTAENRETDNVTRKRDVSLALLEAYRNIAECCILHMLAVPYCVMGHVCGSIGHMVSSQSNPLTLVM